MKKKRIMVEFKEMETVNGVKDNLDMAGMRRHT